MKARVTFVLLSWFAAFMIIFVAFGAQLEDLPLPLRALSISGVLVFSMTQAVIPPQESTSQVGEPKSRQAIARGRCGLVVADGQVLRLPDPSVGVHDRPAGSSNNSASAGVGVGVGEVLRIQP